MSNLICRINEGLDLDVLEIDVTWTLSAVASFNVTVLARSFNYRRIRGTPIEVIRNGVTLISGFVEKSPDLPVKTDGALRVKLSCLGELGLLTCIKAQADARFQDEIVVDILNQFLLSASDWVLDTSTMIDPTETTTVQLDNTETLFSQIVKTVKNTPQVHLRYGGIDPSGDYILEVGYFINTNYWLIQDHNLIDVTLRTNSRRCYSAVDAYSSFSDDQRITLLDALADTRTFNSEYYARFPIEYSAFDDSFVVVDTEADCVCSVRKSFSLIKPATDPPTASEIAETGYALYLKAVRFLLSTEDYDTYEVTAIFNEPPLVGDSMYLKSVVNEPFINSMNGNVEFHPTFEVDGTFRIVEVRYKGENAVIPDTALSQVSNNQSIFQIDLTSSDEAEDIDSDTQVYERLEKADDFDATTFPTIATDQASLQQSEVTDVANCTVVVANDGRLFTVPSPAVPGGTTDVVTVFEIDNDDFYALNVVPPATPGNSWAGCITRKEGQWGDGVATPTVTVTFIWLS